MHRRETDATTASRMLVRFFGGFEFEPEDATMASELCEFFFGTGRPDAAERPELRGRE